MAIVMIFVGTMSFSLPTQAATKSTLKITNQTKPTTIMKGKYFDCKGTITSNYKITWVGGYILASNGSTIVQQTGAKPNAKSYSLYGKAIDLNLKFNKLQAGTYYYKITAHDASGRRLTLIYQKFTVTNPSTLAIKNATKPTNIEKGKYFDCKGTISSNYNITWVGGYILASNGSTIVQQTGEKPNAKSYSIYGKTIDKNLKFNNLSAGTYYYKITAHDASGKKLTLINQKFTVTAPKKVVGTKNKELDVRYASGKQPFYTKMVNGKAVRVNSVSCTAWSNAYALSIVDKKTYSGKTMWLKYNKDEYSYKTYLYTRMKYKTCSSQKATLREIYDQINKGKPCLLRVANNTHSVCIYGYKNVTDPNNMTLANLLMLDPVKYSANETNLKYTVTQRYHDFSNKIMIMN